METARERIQHFLELYEAGIAIRRSQLRREHPQDDEAALEVRFREWLAERPGAEHGDGVGRSVPWPRPK